MLPIPVDGAGPPIRTIRAARRPRPTWAPRKGERVIVPDPRPFEPRRRPRPETCTVGCTRRIADRRAFVQLPSLRLSGQWLADAGFAVGAKPRVEVIEGALTLTPSAATESPEPGSRPRTKPLRRAKA